ncbi:MAG: hypothetical protein M1837_006340 [Sclerophora amabilis]|nr:MAG: hypothetical protein M1837_006340 [Sclerophora amabilis]
MPERNTFYLLEPFEVLQNPESWLGRIVKDYRKPRDGCVPSAPASFVDAVDDDNFADVDALISRTRSTAFGASLVQLFGSSFERSRTDGVGVQAREVHRIRLQDPDAVLARLQQDTSVAARLDEWLSLKPFRSPVYFVVGFLVAQDPILSSRAERSKGVGGSVDPVGIAAAATGVPMPIEGLEASVEQSHSRGENISTMSPGTRIFAMEYKILRKTFHKTGIKNEGHGPQDTATFSGRTRIAAPSEVQETDEGTVIEPGSEEIETILLDPSSEDPESGMIDRPPDENIEQQSMLEDFEWMGDSRFGVGKIADTSIFFPIDGDNSPLDVGRPTVTA